VTSIYSWIAINNNRDYLVCESGMVGLCWRSRSDPDRL